MFARVEVAIRPDFSDPGAVSLLRRLQMAHPNLFEKIRWGRMLEVFWLDFPAVREEIIPAVTEIFWDPVLQWLFTGNLIPAAGGKSGSIQDLLERAPHRPGKFWALERRFRPGVTDNVGRTAHEAFEIVLGRKFPNGRASSGSLLILEGPQLTEEMLRVIARDLFCNELIETWSIFSEEELKHSDRFHQERIKRDFPKISLRESDQVETIQLEKLSDEGLLDLSDRKLWALTLQEMRAIRDFFSAPIRKEERHAKGLPGPTDVEMEVLAQTWSEHCKHKIFGARFQYQDLSGQTGNADHERIPSEVDNLFKTTISGTTSQLPKPWLLSVFHDNAGIVAWDDEDALCIKVETHNTPSALDPYGGALTGIVGVNRDILGCGLGAKPIFNTDVFCVAVPDYAQSLPDRIMHPRRILDGVRRGVEHGGNKSGIPTVNGALVFDDRYLGKPLVYCGTGGFMPKVSAGRQAQVKEIRSGDRICMVGGRIGKDGIHGATFSSLALTEASPSAAVQLGDPITQKRMADFLLEARDLGFYRAITDNGAGGLSSSVGELARLSGGAHMDVSLAKTKYPGLKPFELVVSESQERMTVAVPPEKMAIFLALADRRGVEVSDLGFFNDSGKFEIYFQEKCVGSLDLNFLHGGSPRLELRAEWTGRKRSSPPAEPTQSSSFGSSAHQILLELLGRPNIASKEWLIRQYDHEVQGMSVVKPLHTVGIGTSTHFSGPNDGAVIKPKPHSMSGIAVACGINPKLSDIDPYLMAQSAVDEAVRNLLCVGAEFGREDSLLALVDNFCWPDPVESPEKAGALVRACFGMKRAALALGTPFISGKDSMKNDFRGKREGKPVSISVPPTLLVTAMGRVPDIRFARTADFKAAGDLIYLLTVSRRGIQGSELAQFFMPIESQVAEPDWGVARRVYDWIGGAKGKQQGSLKSLHDVSEGGLLVALAESMLARGIGAVIEIPEKENPWEFCFGEGFHCFVASIPDADAQIVEAEWSANGVPYLPLGLTKNSDHLEVRWKEESVRKSFQVGMKSIRDAWKKEGYWQ